MNVCVRESERKSGIKRENGSDSGSEGVKVNVSGCECENECEKSLECERDSEYV